MQHLLNNNTGFETSNFVQKKNIENLKINFATVKYLSAAATVLCGINIKVACVYEDITDMIVARNFRFKDLHVRGLFGNY